MSFNPSMLPAKTPFNVVDLFIGLVLNTYFLTMAAVQYSVSLYSVDQLSNADFALLTIDKALLPQFLNWNDNAPIIGIWMMLMLAIIPIALLKQGVDAFTTLTKKATTFRHLLDLFHFVFLVTLLYVNIAFMVETKNEILSLLSSSPSLLVGSAEYSDLVISLNSTFRILFFANFVGWLLPIIRYNHEVTNGNVNQPQYHEGKRLEEEQKKKKTL